MQDELKLRESRWSAAATRYKDRITNLENENKEMKEEVKLLEKQNLELQRKDQQKVNKIRIWSKDCGDYHIDVFVRCSYFPAFYFRAFSVVADVRVQKCFVSDRCVGKAVVRYVVGGQTCYA